MDFMKLAESRYSVRKFSDRPVESEKLEAILRAGQISPTACNKQPQRVLAIRSPEALTNLKKCTHAHFGETLALLICYDREECWVRGCDGKRSGEIDASIVTTQMMYAAWELGIGSTWVMDFLPEAVREEFQLPEGYEPVNLLLMGYPAEDCLPSPAHSWKKPLEETSAYDCFQK